MSARTKHDSAYRMFDGLDNVTTPGQAGMESQKTIHYRRPGEALPLCNMSRPMIPMVTWMAEQAAIADTGTVEVGSVKRQRARRTGYVTWVVCSKCEKAAKPNTALASLAAALPTSHALAMTNKEAKREHANRSRRFAELESIIESGIKGFVSLGLALREIRDGRLYKQLTFEAYVSERWDLSRAHAYRMIDAATIAELTNGGIANERQARELAPLLNQEGGEDVVRETFARIKHDAEAEKKKVTAARIRAEVLGVPYVPTGSEANLHRALLYYKGAIKAIERMQEYIEDAGVTKGKAAKELGLYVHELDALFACMPQADE